MAIVFLGLGSNLGDRSSFLMRAIDEINQQIGCIISRSAILTTDPWGYDSDNYYMNMVVKVITNTFPIDLLHKTQHIERTLGRMQKSVDGHYFDRPIDIDILFYDQLKMSSEELIIPHPLLHERLFVLQSICEIAPQWVHPCYNKTIIELKQELLQCTTK